MANKYGIPILKVESGNLPSAWEKAVLAAWENGEDIKTEYDKPNDPRSKDCTMIIVVKFPMKEPRIHRAFPGGLEDLEVYRQEVVLGIHDHWINPEEGKWTYTYHKRLFDYETEDIRTNQMDLIIDKLSKAPHSRRAQAITWNVKLDSETDDPPCLQRLWFRVSALPGGKKVLNMNSHWRSRDAFKASFMNMFALTDLQKTIAEEISRRQGEEIGVGRYVDISDSFHIYGSYHEDFKKFLQTVKSRSFPDRTWHTKFAEPFFEDARKKIALEKEGELKQKC
ncbi:MAG: thymidylate synthase [Candidatus Omnitrophota bacterium]|nr:thymidylate synthase [Candidatus Omnitrophota bacterium]